MRCGFLACALLLLAPSIARSTTTSHTISWSETLTSATGVGGSTALGRAVNVDGAAHPCRVVRVEIPADERVVGLRLSPITVRPTDLSRLVPPATDPLKLSVAAGESGGYRYWLLGHADLRGHRIAYVLVEPFRTDHVLEAFTLEVETVPAETTALARRIAPPRTAGADRRALARSLDADPLPEFVHTDRAALPPELDASVVEYVIITTDEMASTFQELADFKTREGLPAEVTTIEWIVESYEGNDVQARVREHIRDRYLYQGLRYVLIGGDASDVPMRLARNHFQAPSGVDLTSDLYYAALDGDWNADGNATLCQAPNVYVSYPGDDADLLADVSIARVPVSTAAQASQWITKWKSYTGYDPSTFRTDYQDRILELAEVLFPAEWASGDDPGEITVDGADIAEETLGIVPGNFEKTKLYEYATNPAHPTPVLTRAATLAEIDTGYGLIDHTGHGFRTNMGVGDGSLVNADADAVTNANAYSILYAINCTSGAVLYDCIVEHFVRNPSGGILGGVSSTDLDYPAVSKEFKFEFFDLVFNQDVTTLADAYHEADAPFIGFAAQNDNAWRWTVQTLITLGDPALEIWRAAPRTLDLAFDPGHEIGETTFPITVTDGGAPVENARVCLWQSSGGYGVGFTDASGAANVEFLPETTGPFDITVTKNSYVPARAIGDVISGSAPALRVDAWTVHDGIGGGSGNGDARPDAGESIVVDVTLRNEGPVTATGVSATFIGNSPHLVVTDGSQSFANVAPGGTATAFGAFAFDVSASLPADLRHVVASSRVVMSASAGSWEQPNPFSLYQRVFDLVGNAWSIKNDDGDGLVESGETVEIFLTVLNLGEADAVSVTGVATYSDAGFVLVGDTIAFGTIPSGQSVQTGSIQFVSTGGSEDDLSFGFSLSDAQGGSLMFRQVDLKNPPAPGGLDADPAGRAIRLTWDAAAATDLRGYRVSRSLNPGGPFVEVSGVKVVDDGSFFEDEGLAPLTRYYYTVAAVDSSGNAGPPSAVFQSSTTPAPLTGWPVLLPSGLSKGSPTLASLDAVPGQEIVLGWSYPMVFDSDGTDYVDGDSDPATIGVFADLESGASQFWTSPAVADIDRDGVLEIVFAAWQTDVHGHLYVLDATGAIEPGWPREVGRNPWSTPLIADIDGGDLEIFQSSGANNGDYKGALMGFRHDGAEILDGDGDPTTHGVFYKSASDDAKFMYTSPAAGDIDGDGFDEVVFLEKTVHPDPSQSSLYVFDADGSVLTGFPYTTNLVGSNSSPVIADLDGDASLDIVAVTPDRIVVVDAAGNDAPGWPKVLPPVTSSATKEFLGCPAIGDVNADGNLDIALGWLDGTVHLWTGATGVSHGGFPVQIMSTGATFSDYLRSAIIGNVDADPRPEILVSSGENRLFAVSHDATITTGFPIPLSGIAWGSVALGDIDLDGGLNLVVQTDAPLLEVFDLGSVPYVPGEHPWSAFRNGPRKRGLYIEPSSVAVPGADMSQAHASVGAPRPNPARAAQVRLPFQVPPGGSRVVVRVFDVSGREVRRLADGRFPQGRFTIRWDGRTSSGEALAAGVYLARVEIGAERFGRKITLVH